MPEECSAGAGSSPARTWVERLFGQPWPGLLLFALFGILPGLGALSAGLLLAYDDKWATTNNPLIVNGLSAIGSFLLLPFTGPREVWLGIPQWAPLSLFAEALEHALCGHAGTAGQPLPADFVPWSFRLVTALCHGLCGWLVLRLGRRFTGRLEAGLFAGLVFLFHPVVCESVCWIAEQNNVLPVLFGLLALDVYSDVPAGAAPSWKRTAAAAGLLLLSQLAKVSGISWWPVLAAWDVLYAHSTWPRRLVRLTLLLPPVALSVYVVRLTHAELFLPPLGDPPLGPWLMSVYLFFRYLGLLAWPVNLSAFYHVSPGLLPVAGWLFGLTAFLAVACLAWRAGMPLRRVLFYAVWMAVGVAPHINPWVNVAFVLQDRYLYPSLPAFALFLAELLGLLTGRLPLVGRRVLAVLLLAVLLALAVQRSTAWRSEARLFADAARKQPHSAFGHVYLASYLFHASAVAPDESTRQNMRHTALLAHEAALGCDDYERTLCPLWYKVELASLLAEAGNVAGARALFRGVWEGRPARQTEEGAKFYAVRFLASEALSSGRIEEGLRLTEEGLKIAPQSPEFLADRLRAWLDLGRKDEARAEAQRLLHDPRLRNVAQEVLRRLDRN